MVVVFNRGNIWSMWCHCTDVAVHNIVAIPTFCALIYNNYNQVKNVHSFFSRNRVTLDSSYQKDYIYV